MTNLVPFVAGRGLGGDERGVVRQIRNSLSSPYPHPVSGHAQLTPLGRSSGAVELEIGLAAKVAFQVRMIVDGGTDSGEILQTSHAPIA